MRQKRAKVGGRLGPYWLGAIAVCVAIWCALGSVARAADAVQDALNQITDTANRICNQIPVSGEQRSLEVNGDVQAELGKLLKRLADLGISGTGKYTSEEWVGVLQKDLPNVLQDNAQCKLTVFMNLQGKLLPNASPPTPPPAAWNMSPEQAEALRLRINPIDPKPPIYIKCRTMAADCERLAYVLFDVLKNVLWPVAEPMTSRGGNVMITGERGIVIISTSKSAVELKDALQASEAGGLPAEMDRQGDASHILINIGDRP